MISLSLPYLYLLHVMVISIRVGSTLLFAPIWGNPALPKYLRVVLVFSIAAGVSAIVPFSAQAYSNPGLILPTEFLIGLLLTMGIRIAFAGLHLGGQLISNHLGFSMVQSIDPQTENRSTLMSGYVTLIGYVMLLAANQHYMMFRALAESYKAFPIGGSITLNQWFGTLTQVSAELFMIGWKIALPIFVITFVLELTVGFISRIQPQINTMVITAPMKLLVGLVALGASLALMPRIIGPVVETMVLRK
jgi:flagellar biosynthetic protein FliR